MAAAQLERFKAAQEAKLAGQLRQKARVEAEQRAKAEKEAAGNLGRELKEVSLACILQLTVV